MRLTPLTTLLSLLAACGSPTAPVLSGQWGGPDAAITLADSGGSALYICGGGSIDPGWSTTADGRWTATGLYLAGGGPSPPPGAGQPHPARYTGTVRGDRLVFTVTLTDVGDVLGPYTVERGRSGPSTQCY